MLMLMFMFMMLMLLLLRCCQIPTVDSQLGCQQLNGIFIAETALVPRSGMSEPLMNIIFYWIKLK